MNIIKEEIETLNEKLAEKMARNQKFIYRLIILLLFIVGLELFGALFSFFGIFLLGFGLK